MTQYWNLKLMVGPFAYFELNKASLDYYLAAVKVKTNHTIQSVNFL